LQLRRFKRATEALWLAAEPRSVRQRLRELEDAVAGLAKLSSNRGGEFLQLDFITLHDCGPDEGADCNVLFTTSDWSEGEPRPVVLDLGCLHLSLVALSALLADAQRWLNLPLAELTATPFVCEHELAFTPHFSLLVRFGSRADTISGANPVLTASFSVGSLSGELHLVTDQSCLASFLADLRAAIPALRSRGADA